MGPDRGERKEGANERAVRRQSVTRAVEGGRGGPGDWFLYGLSIGLLILGAVL